MNNQEPAFPSLRDKLAQSEQEDGCPVCGSDVHDRDALDKAEREIERLTTLMAQPEQKKPQNCGTGYCSCIECVMAPSGCAECGVSGGHALYCVACAEKFVGGYKDSGVPAVTTELVQVSPDIHSSQRTWVGLTPKEVAEIVIYPMNKTDDLVRAIEAKLKEKNT